jgi:hypothetical protein
VTLDGSGSSDDNEIMTYEWSLVSSTDPSFNDTSDVGLSDLSAATATFNAPTLEVGEPDIELVFALTVTDDAQYTEDGIANSTTEQVTITISAEADGTGPLALIAFGDQSVNSGVPVTLDGSGSMDNTGDPDGIVSYVWTFEGSDSDDVTEVDLTHESTDPSQNTKVTFTAPTVEAGNEDVNLTFRLEVESDNSTNTDDVEVVITVLAETDEVDPLAYIEGGDRTFASGEVVDLDGSGSSDNNDIVTYLWTVTQKDDTEVAYDVEDATAMETSFTAPVVLYGEDDLELEVILAVTDVDNNPGTDTVTITITAQLVPDGAPTVEETQTAIAKFMQSRAGHVVSAQPDLIGLLSGASNSTFAANVAQGSGGFNFANSGERRIWSQAQGSWSTSGDAENSYYFGAVGGHFELSPHAIAGLMFEFDSLTQEDDTTSSSGVGYLVGPYFVAKSPTQPLFFEGRYLLGATSNTTSIDGAADQDFDTSRSLIQVKVAGQVVSNTTTLTPSLSFTHLTDTQGAFTDNYNREIAEQGIAVSNATFGLDFAKPVLVQNGEMQLTGGVAGSWSASNNSGFASTITPNYEGGSASLHLGTVYTMPNGITLSADGSYSGLGVENYQSFGGSLGLTLAF